MLMDMARDDMSGESDVMVSILIANTTSQYAVNTDGGFSQDGHAVSNAGATYSKLTAILFDNPDDDGHGNILFETG